MFDKLKKLFVVDDGKVPKVEEVKQVSEKKTSKNKIEKPVSVSSPIVDVAPVSGKPDEKFMNILLKAIESNNLEGFDYLEYKQSVQSLANMDMDEATRYQSSMAMAKTMGVSPGKLVESAKHYLNILDGEKNRFQQAVKGQRQKLLQDQTTGLKSLEKSIADKENHIKKLQLEIQKEKEKLAKSSQEIKTNGAKIENTNNQFMYAFKIVVDQIVGDIDKMNKYLK